MIVAAIIAGAYFIVLIAVLAVCYAAGKPTPRPPQR